MAPQTERIDAAALPGVMPAGAMPVARTAAPATMRRSTYGRGGKRLADVAGALALLVGLAPLMALVALAIKLTSGGPVLYASERAGLHGRRFRMWKFRTMQVDADEQYEDWKQTRPHLADALARDWQLDADPRVTLLGRALRRSSLDELPQVWNVLRGEMSLVGPRPYLPREQLDPALAARIHAAKPGLTGPFQVRGRKGLAPRERMTIEAAYGERVTAWGDLRYLLATVRPLLRLDGR